MFKKIYLLLSVTLLSGQLYAQEFKATISVSAAQIEGSDKTVYQGMQKALYEFINERVWSNYAFRVEEKIDVTFMLTLSERVSSSEYRGRLNIIYRRPVYRTSYETPMFNYVDKDIQFSYDEGQTLVFSDNSFDSNLTSIFAYYLYLIIGLDFDTFQLYGGTQFYQKAQAVVNSAQSAVEPGWKAFEGMKNRYWLVENLLNSSYSSVRQFLYKYHRRGLDMMSDNLELGRTSITESLEDLRKAYRAEPNLFVLQLLLEAKRDELKNIYMEANEIDKAKAVAILSEVDPSNSSSYQKILVPHQ
jgi:translation elongation factor P/translation initiation factor 5A